MTQEELSRLFTDYFSQKWITREIQSHWLGGKPIGGL